MKQSQFAVLVWPPTYWWLVLPASTRTCYNRGEVAKKGVVVALPKAKENLRDNETQPEIYIVKKGDTLYSMRLITDWIISSWQNRNGIKIRVIHIGQQIRLYANNAANNAVGTIQPVTVDSKPLQPVCAIYQGSTQGVKYAYSDSAAAQIDKVQGLRNLRLLLKLNQKRKSGTAG